MCSSVSYPRVSQNVFSGGYGYRRNAWYNIFNCPVIHMQKRLPLETLATLYIILYIILSIRQYVQSRRVGKIKAGRQ